MSSLLHISPKLRNGAILGMASSIEAGASAVKVLLFSIGSGIPANEAVVISDQVLLAEHPSNLGPDAFEDAATSGSLSANAFDDVLAQAEGDPAFFRLIDANGEVAMQGTAGTAGTHMIVDTQTYVTGGDSRITGFSVTIPASA
jgi:hypothetical protein